MQRHIVYCMFLRVSPATKSTKFGSRYLGEGSSELDEILQISRERLLSSNTQSGDLWPWGAKILKGVKFL